MRLKNWIAFLLLALMAACSTSITDDDSLPDSSAVSGDEDVGSTQQALLTCTRPTGSCGTQTHTLGYITSVHVNGVNAYQLDIVYSYTDPGTYGPPVGGVVDFGVNQAAFSGSGWSGTKITSMRISNPQQAGCMFGTNFYCWFINESLAFTMDQRVSNLVPSANGIQLYGSGITKFRGYGLVDPQKFRFYYDSAGTVTYHTWTVLGPAMTTCSDPG